MVMGIIALLCSGLMALTTTVSVMRDKLETMSDLIVGVCSMTLTIIPFVVLIKLIF